jgi:hypothetical protein
MTLRRFKKNVTLNLSGTFWSRLNSFYWEGTKKNTTTTTTIRIRMRIIIIIRRRRRRRRRRRKRRRRSGICHSVVESSSTQREMLQQIGQIQ